MTSPRQWDKVWRKTAEFFNCARDLLGEAEELLPGEIRGKNAE